MSHLFQQNLGYVLQFNHFHNYIQKYKKLSLNNFQKFYGEIITIIKILKNL